jgi:hypothetical protein
MTYEGIVVPAITGGQIKANNVSIAVRVSLIDSYDSPSFILKQTILVTIDNL